MSSDFSHIASQSAAAISRIPLGGKDLKMAKDSLLGALNEPMKTLRDMATAISSNPLGALGNAAKGVTVFGLRTGITIVTSPLLIGLKIGFAVWQGGNALAAKYAQRTEEFAQPAAAEAIHDQVNVGEVIASTPKIAFDFTQRTSIGEQRKAHEAAKTFLRTNLPAVGGEVTFISAKPPKSGAVPRLEGVRIVPTGLNSNVFSAEYTSGVKGDMQRAGQRTTDNIVVFGAASQFNGAEAPSSYTLEPGKAVATYTADRTQGPQAQLAYSNDQVELINCGANVGYNGLCQVLDGQTKGAVAHGYLMPNPESEKKVVDQLRNSGHNIEYPCVSAVPVGGTEPVHMILISAPNITNQTSENLDEISFLAAYNGYKAQFEHCVRLAKENGKPVELKATAVGLGAFSNKPEIVAKAFYAAALECEKELGENQVSVAFQIFNSNGRPDPKASEMANHLGLSPSNIET